MKTEIMYQLKNVITDFEVKIYQNLFTLLKVLHFSNLKKVSHIKS